MGSIKRRKGGLVIVDSITDDTSKEVLHILRNISEACTTR